MRKHPIGDQEIKYGLLFGSLLAHPTVMMKTDLIKRLKYNPDWDKAEDYELWTRSDLLWVKLANIPEVPLKYRVHPAQISSATNIQQQKLLKLVRRSYWKYSGLVRHLDNDFAEELLKLYELALSKINMDKVDFLVFRILSEASRESQLVI
ncbi:hypothetical protein [Polynucleobacter necessarius]|uniref:hypothetical protein n=1 Tax=Polynucleobacter necessarius TaxID=576610 RepID=UPI000E093C31|nr:hypothetical protein [Polynucleobacter necessarius]